jgi:hypothetical protein
MHPDIQDRNFMTGGSDYFLRVEVASAGEFGRIHKEILSTLPACLAHPFKFLNQKCTREAALKPPHGLIDIRL